MKRFRLYLISSLYLMSSSWFSLQMRVLSPSPHCSWKLEGHWAARTECLKICLSSVEWTGLECHKRDFKSPSISVLKFHLLPFQ